ncbi:MAG: rRNA maturation RNase YbeY [Clostridia bacterium]
MKQIAEIEYVGIPEKKEYEEQIEKVLGACFKEERLEELNLAVSITLTEESYIQQINKHYRNIDKATDVLSFPMFEKEEIEQLKKQGKSEIEDVLGDIVISIPQVEKQANEYGHSFQREFSYMLVHGFYHLMGYDHIQEGDKKKMRPKEEAILQILDITRS